MTEILNALSTAYQFVASLNFNTLLTITLCVFAAVFLLCFILSLTVPAFSNADKRPFLALVNLFTGLIFIVFTTAYPITFCIFCSAVFWIIGYLLYGALTLAKRSKKTAPPLSQTVSALPALAPADESLRPDVPAAQSNVRVSHALSITDKLLLKNLGRGDRQELEKMRQTLTVLQAKGNITPQEGEILNEHFNALLKIMAKYNL